MFIEEPSGQEPQTTTISPELASKLNALTGEGQSAFMREMGAQQPSQTQVEPQTQPIDSADPANIQSSASQLGLDGAEPNNNQPATDPAAQQKVTNPLEIDSPLFGGKFDLSSQQKPNTDSSLKNIDEINSYITSKIQGVESFDDLLNRYQSVTQEREELVKSKEVLDRFQEAYQKMDPQLLKAIDMAERGEDWRSVVLSTPNLSFSKSATDYKKEELVKAYFGNEVTQDDFEQWGEDSNDYDPKTSKLMDVYYAQAVERFNRDKENNTLTLEQVNQRNLAQQQKYAQSVEESLASIKRVMPHVSNEYIETIKADFLQNKINSLFSTSEGTVDPDAGIRYALAKDGVELVKQLMAVAQDRAETETNLSILERSNRTPVGGNSSGTSVGAKEISKELQEKLSFLTKGLNDTNSMFKA